MAIDTRFLTKLGIKKFNNGTSTGLKSSNSKNYQPSPSPVDGHLIGAVSNTTPKEYDKVIQEAEEDLEETLSFQNNKPKKDDKKKEAKKK